MKKSLMVSSLLALAVSVPVQAVEMCQVTACNKIERFSINPMAHLRDSFGETCFEITLPKDQAIVDRELAADSRWYQGSFNPTKKSVTLVKSVHQCQEVKYQ